MRFNVESGPAMKVSCSLIGPSGDVLLSEHSVEEAQDTFTIAQTGRHDLCFNGPVGSHVIDFDLVLQSRPHLAARLLPSGTRCLLALCGFGFELFDYLVV